MNYFLLRSQSIDGQSIELFDFVVKHSSSRLQVCMKLSDLHQFAQKLEASSRAGSCDEVDKRLEQTFMKVVGKERLL